MPGQRGRRRLATVEKNHGAHNDEGARHSQIQEGQGSQEVQTSREPRKIPKFAYIKLDELRKDLLCPICLGLMRNTRAVMDCLHRFCGECIDKVTRLTEANKECPVCRTHIASRRSLRDDPNTDALISALFPDFDKHEEEELTFPEEERTRNKELQASFSQTLARQEEAAKSKRAMRSRNAKRGRDDAWEVVYERTYGDQQDDANASHPDEEHEEGTQQDDAYGSHPDEENEEPSPQIPDDSHSENEAEEVPQEGEDISHGPHLEEVVSWEDQEVHRENEGVSRGPHPEIEDDLKARRARRMQRLIEHFSSLEDVDLEIHLLLVPADKETTPTLEWPYLSVPAKLTINDLCEYVARHSCFVANEVEILVVKAEINTREGTNPSFSKDDLKLLEGGHRTLGEALDGHPLLRKEYTLAFRPKETAN